MPKKEKPLTLEVLADYNQEVLFPAMEERFVVKRDFNELKGDFNELKGDFNELKKDFKEFKNESLGNQDAMLKKLDILITEKEARAYQEEKEKKLWALVIKALKDHNILSPKELEEISHLEIF